ncbi:MAG TPA: winged helix-turn-helix transcriptional regulator [Elusimicrobiota bacterium]|nr:winged helix-turn-helix transcriptional regulator [Elusimicrobiota bacterium]
MNNNIPEDKIYRILDLIAGTPGLSQREVAANTGLSLGLVNITLKRLAQTGSIKVSELNKRKMEYMLTPKGLFEKTQRAYSYISNTVRTFQEYQHRLERLLHELLTDRHTPVVILGYNELGMLVEMVIRTQFPDVQFRVLLSENTIHPEELVFDCRFGKQIRPVGISILEKLLKAPAGKKSSDEGLPQQGNIAQVVGVHP